MIKGNIYFLLLIFLIKILGKGNIDDVVIIKNNPFYEPEKGVGAHYYAYSPYYEGYTKVTSYIQLPSSFESGNRNGYISFGVLGLNGGIDIGIRNTGNGWHPYYYDVRNKNFKVFEENMAPSNTKIIGIEVEIKSTKQILFSLSYRESNLNIIKLFTKQLEAKHIFENGNTFRKRFYRFASLPPEGEDDQNDGTRMIDGKFTGLSIVKNGSVKQWGISEEDIESAWMVSSSRINLTYNKSTDNFSIIHRESEKVKLQDSKDQNSFIFPFI